MAVLEDLCFAPRLGRGVARTSRLDPLAVERTIVVLAQLMERVRAHGVRSERIRAAGTAVLRRAADARDFLSRVESRLGLEIEVLTAEEEARLAYRAVVSDVTLADRIVIDVGGGSTEVVAPGGHLRFSIPLGAVVLTETYLAEEPLLPGSFPALCAACIDAARPFPEALALRDPASREVVVLGGTGLNLACLARGFAAFDHELAEGSVLPAARAREWSDRLCHMPLDARLRLPIESTRADILPAGLACLAAAVERIGAEGLRVTGRGLRFGLLQEALSRG